MEQQDQITEMFGDKQIRWYQVACKNEMIEGLEEGILRQVIVLPTGTGKTVAIAFSLSSPEVHTALGIHDRPLRVLFAAHMHTLLSQAEKTFIDNTNIELIPHSIFQDLPDDVQWDVCILDESHHEACASFQHQLDKIGDKPIIGLTATPDRADNCLIKFEKVINPISREQAVLERHLAETTLHSFIDSPDKDKVDITKDIINNYGHLFGQTMMFFRTKAEVREVANFLIDQGYSCIPLLNQTGKQIDHALELFSEGEVQFLVNCNKINEGVDVKGCSDVYLGRQFGSYPQLNQVVGRASRPDSSCNVWELINPLSGRNLDTTVVVGTPKEHTLYSQRKGQWKEQQFDYTYNTKSQEALLKFQ